jgi:hypothetical protein
MPKPTVIPEWASNPGATFDPGLPYSQAGWTVGTKPPARVLNWWQNLVFLWCEYLNQFENYAHTWTADQTIDSGSKLVVDAPNVIKYPNTIKPCWPWFIFYGGAGWVTTFNGQIYNNTVGTSIVMIPIALSQTEELHNVQLNLIATGVATTVILDLMLKTDTGSITSVGNTGIFSGTATAVVQNVIVAATTTLIPQPGEQLYLQVTASVAAAGDIDLISAHKTVSRS